MLTSNEREHDQQRDTILLTISLKKMMSGEKKSWESREPDSISSNSIFTAPIQRY